jgi:hypothetical protein
MGNESHEIKLSWHIEGGQPGTDNDPNNPLSRAARSPLVDGRPQQNLSLCFYSDSIVNGTEGKQNLKWFGVFVLSSAGKLVFFPGFNFTPTWVKVAKNRSREKRHDIHIDHITLEQNLHHWHFTSPGSKDHLGSGLTAALGDNRFLWFGMSVAGSDVLKAVRQETVFHTLVPASDTTRRADAFMASREGMVFNILSIHPDAKQRFDKGFLHFGLIVGPPGFTDDSGPNFGIPFESPFIIEKLPNPLTNIPLRRHRVSMGSRMDIEIVALWLPGSLTERAVFTGPTSM